MGVSVRGNGWTNKKLTHKELAHKRNKMNIHTSRFTYMCVLEETPHKHIP